jgi:hypothetical protein
MAGSIFKKFRGFLTRKKIKTELFFNKLGLRVDKGK